MKVSERSDAPRGFWASRNIAQRRSVPVSGWSSVAAVLYPHFLARAIRKLSADVVTISLQWATPCWQVRSTKRTEAHGRHAPKASARSCSHFIPPLSGTSRAPGGDLPELRLTAPPLTRGPEGVSAERRRSLPSPISPIFAYMNHVNHDIIYP
jgi:hypothetical protein